MTLIYESDRPIEGSEQVHILIVGVATYADIALKYLDGLKLSVERLSRWWIDAGNGRLTARRELASVDVLLSDHRGALLLDRNGAPVQIEKATFTNARAAFRRWAAHGTKPSLLVLHWIGHGAVDGNGASAPLHAIYCEDVAQAGDDRIQHGFDWFGTLKGIEAHAPRARIVCFMDTCRTWAGGQSKPPLHFPTPFDTHRVDRDRALVFYASDVGEATCCAAPDQDVGGDFSGGALFTEATRLGLGRFGAELWDDEIGHAIYPGALREAIEQRLQRWKQRDRKLKDMKLRSRVLSGEWGESEPIVLAPAPESMVEFTSSSSADSPNLTCALSERHGAPVPLHADGHRWECDARRKLHDLEVSIRKPWMIELPSDKAKREARTKRTEMTPAKPFVKHRVKLTGEP